MNKAIFYSTILALVTAPFVNAQFPQDPVIAEIKLPAKKKKSPVEQCFFFQYGAVFEKAQVDLNINSRLTMILNVLDRSSPPEKPQPEIEIQINVNELAELKKLSEKLSGKDRPVIIDASGKKYPSDPMKDQKDEKENALIFVFHTSDGQKPFVLVFPWGEIKLVGVGG